jgi:hypothetical protein
MLGRNLITLFSTVNTLSKKFSATTRRAHAASIRSTARMRRYGDTFGTRHRASVANKTACFSRVLEIHRVHRRLRDALRGRHAGICEKTVRHAKTIQRKVAMQVGLRRRTSRFARNCAKLGSCFAPRETVSRVRLRTANAHRARIDRTIRRLMKHPIEHRGKRSNQRRRGAAKRDSRSARVSPDGIEPRIRPNRGIRVGLGASAICPHRPRSAIGGFGTATPAAMVAISGSASATRGGSECAGDGADRNLVPDEDRAEEIARRSPFEKERAKKCVQKEPAKTTSPGGSGCVRAMRDMRECDGRGRPARFSVRLLPAARRNRRDRATR